MPAWLLWTIPMVVVLAAGAFYASLPWTAQPILRGLLGLHYRVRVTGLDHVPQTGPVLFVCNHVSWLDGFLLASSAPRRGKVLVNAGMVNRPLLRPIALRAGVIPIPFSGPRAIREALLAGGQALDRGEALAIFPEGQISRNGLVAPFQRGLERILQDRPGVVVVPMALDNLWGSLFSNSDGRFFRKRPQVWRRTVCVAFGRPLTPPVTAFTARQGVVEAGVAARTLTGTPTHPLETLDPSLPRWEHPALGLLAASASDYDDGYVRQPGTRPGSVGPAAPGVALRVVDEAGTPLPCDASGLLQALRPGDPDWVGTETRGRLDRDGFVTLETPAG